MVINNNIVNASNEEDKNIWIGYIMELLNDIDKEFSQALEWKLIRTRNCVKNNKTRIG